MITVVPFSRAQSAGSCQGLRSAQNWHDRGGPVSLEHWGQALMCCGDTQDWPQPIPVLTALPWDPPGWTHPWAHVPAQPWPVPVPSEVPVAQGWGCPSAPQLPAPGWHHGRGPGCQALL